MIDHIAANWPVYVGVGLLFALGLWISTAPLDEGDDQ